MRPIDELIDETFRKPIGKLLKFYLWHIGKNSRCQTFNANCPCCILYRATDELLEYGSDQKWLESEKYEYETDENPGYCPTCGKSWEIVRPGKYQPTCMCGYEIENEGDKLSSSSGTPCTYSALAAEKAGEGER